MPIIYTCGEKMNHPNDNVDLEVPTGQIMGVHNAVINSANCAFQVRRQDYRHLFEQIPISIIIIDLNLVPATILDVNRRAELIYGYPAADLIGNPAFLLVPDAFKVNIQNIVQRVQHGETVNAEITNRHRDGSNFPARVIATPDPAQTNHMVVIVEDITLEKQRQTVVEAVEAERLRIAHDIHDGVVQNLAVLRFKSALWSFLADGAPPEMRVALDELQSVLKTSLEDLRRAIFALRPVILEFYLDLFPP